MDKQVKSENNSKISSLNGTYIIRELKEGFDKFNLGDTDIEIEMRPREGTAMYTNFSKKCEVIVAPKDAKYSVGEIVWVPHKQNEPNNKVSGYIYGAEYTKDNVMVCGEHNILFTGEDLTAIESDEWIVFEINKGGKKETELGLITIEAANDEEGFVVCGALPKGSKITWFTSKRMEYFQKEVQYWVTHIDSITSVDGVYTENYYKVDLLGDYVADVNGIKYKGSNAAQKVAGVYLNGKERLAVLSNPSLPLTGQVVIVSRVRKCRFVRPSDVIAVVGTAEKVLGESTPA